MSKENEEFLKELLNDFKTEAAEHLEAISGALLKLEKVHRSADRQSTVEILFREIHSMKGAARAVNLVQIEMVCMSLENVLGELKKETIEFAKPMVDIFLEAADIVEEMVMELDSPHKRVSENSIKQIIAKLKGITNIPPQRSSDRQQPTDYEKQGQSDTPEAHSGKQPSLDSENETIRVSTEKLYEMLRMAEGMIALKSELQHQAERLQNIYGHLALCKKKYESRIGGIMKTLDKVDFVEIEKEREQRKKNQGELDQLTYSAFNLTNKTERSIDELIRSIRKTLLQPFSTLFTIVPRIVRDLAKEHDKEVNIELTGGETEIDRRILQQIKSPLIHIIRNCIDHGIEARNERINKGKPPTGQLRVDVTDQSAHEIEIKITDDGAGINHDKLLESALKAGYIKEDEAARLSSSQLNRLIFLSGITTSPFITDISGRGLGMAIVAEKIAELGGKIDVTSNPGRGTVFSVLLPQTLASFRGIMVSVSGNKFLISTASVLKAVRIKLDSIRTIETRNTIRLDNENISLITLEDALGIRRHHKGRDQKKTITALIFEHAQKKIGLVVDDILDEHEGLLKPLGKQLKDIKNLSGAIVIGDGRIIPVLNIPELLQSATESIKTDAITRDLLQDKRDDKPVGVLVAEDSITVRNMLRNYLESAGYIVKTAVDGQEALEMFKNEDFDIVVTDVEMPRLNGFELTEKIRKSSGQMPVILVTALESEDDRKRGMEAGANAYIVKSSFEKGNLIDTIKRLT